MTNAVPSPEFDPFAGPVIIATAPSTEPQREIWTASALGDDASLAFNESVTVRLRGPLDSNLLGQALTDLVARHEALRMTLSGDGVTLCIGAPFPAHAERHDLRALTADAAQAALVAIAAREVDAPFDLGHGPLFRAHFVELGADDHALVFTAHHIVCDGWSTAVLMRDWAALYNARRKNQPEALAKPDSFSDYARSLAAADDSSKRGHEDYWLKVFAGEIPVLDLPYDRPRPARKTYRAGREDALLSRELISEVRKAGAKSRASLFATLLAGFKALVFRLSGQSDLVIGIPAAGQTSEGHAELVGHCVNMLPLRSAPRAETPFSEFLTGVRKTVLDAQEHQDFTFGTLLTKLPIPRDPSRLPLVSAIFNLDRGMSSEAIGFEGINAELKANPRSHENFDLFLNAVEVDGIVELECQYNSGLFDAATIRRWLDAYRLMLSEIARAPERELGALPVISEAEATQLAAWNATHADFPRQACVHELFEARARHTPAAIACQSSGATLSFGELDARSNRLAARLRGLGVRRGALVGLCLERSLDLLVGLLAILKAGGGYVPLDPGYPSERLAFMVQDSAMSVLLTHSSLDRELALGVRTVVCVDRETESSASDSAAAPPKDDSGGGPEDTCYVIYTSGSTGKPKGVLVPHRAVVNLLHSAAKRPGLNARDTVLAITTLSFDIAVSEIWLPLSVGAKIVLASRETAADGAALRELCEAAKVTFIDATPATYRLLLAAGWQGSPELTLICTGEAMPKDLALALPPLVKAVWNGYGPTETTVWSTFWQVPPACERVLIGRPVDNTQIHILDAQRRQVPIGVTGEMYIAGDGVTLGYWNRPELSPERFVADPFGAPGARMYRTGDLARYLNSGDIECLGRNDNQVKLRGFRIELGEIEDALGQHQSVEQAAVILREDRPGDARLVAYLVLASAAQVSPTELRSHLKKTLPDYMVPADFVTLPTMPLTPSGKIDRRALPAPDASQRESQAQFVGPRNTTEALLAELWAAALNVSRVSVEDDFFALGGHSLLASQILARLRRDHGIELSFRKFFEAPTVARLAEIIDGTPAVAPSAVVALKRRAPGTAVPLSLSQERLWLLEEMHPAQRLVHNLPAAWRLSGPLDPALLQQSLDRVAARQEMLRMTLAIDGNRATQRMSERCALPVAQVDLRAVAEAEREDQMFSQIREQTATLFDLERGPLFRSTLFRLADEVWVYFTVRHNIIWDGWSFDVFLQDLCSIYDALTKNEEPNLPELPVSYGDFVLWQREWIKGAELARQVAFWQKALAGPTPDLALPMDRPRPAQSRYAGASTTVSLTRAEADALTALAHRAGTTLFNLLFAAYTVVLHRYSGQTEIAVGVPVRARTQPEVENLIGPFINAIVLRSTVDPEASFLDHLAKIRDLTLDGFSHQEMPLELLGSRPPMVRAFFSFQDARERPRSLGAAAVRAIDVEPPAAANDLMLWVMDRPHELLAVANFSTEIFDERTIQRLLRSFLSLLGDLAPHSARKICEFSTLSPEDRGEVAALDAAPQPPPLSAAYDLLRERLAATPDDVAFAQGDDTLTYRALDEKARAIASALAQRVEPGSVVAVALPRSIALVSAVFGTFLAGCTVTPIDPAAPAPYLERLLAAADARILLTDNAQRAKLPTREGLTVLSIDEVAESGANGPADVGMGDRSQQAAWRELQFQPNSTVIANETTHAKLVARVRALAARVGSPVSTFVLSGEPLHESFPMQLLLGLALGARTVLGAPRDRADQTLSALLATGSAVCALAPASAWSAAVANGQPAREQVTAIVYGHAPRSLLERLLPSVGRVVRVFVSGPPHGAAFAHTVRNADSVNIIGTSLDHAHVRVLSTAGELLPIGAPGNLVVSAAGLADLGVRARQRSDGSIEIVDESRPTILLSGQRFDPSEVARILEEHPAVDKAIVVAESAPAGEERLIAYFLAKPGQPFTDSELRRHVRTALPEPMVPQLLVELEALPLDAKGVLDRARLPSPFATGSQGDFVAPRSPIERRLSEMFAEALAVPRVGVYDNFFDLGGHSLLCFRVIERIEKELGKRLSPRVLLLSSLEQVAAELDGGSTPTDSATSPAGDRPLPGRVLQKLQGFFRR